MKVSEGLTGVRLLRKVPQALIACGFLGGCSSLAPLTPPQGLAPLRPVLDSSIWVSKQMNARCADSKSADCEPVSNSKRSDPASSCKYAGCIELAMAYGTQWQEHYYASASQDVALRNLLPLPILPLSAVALYRGTATPPQPRLAQGYALAAASLYAGSEYLKSGDRPKTFLEGGAALTCVLGKARAIARPTEDFLAARNAHAALVSHIAKAQAAYSTFRRDPKVLALIATDDAAYAAVKRYVFNRFESRLAYYERVASTVGRALEELDNSGDELRTLVDLIVNATATELLKSQPDIASLKLAVEDLPKLAASLGKVAELPAPVAAPADDTTDDAVSERGTGAAVVAATDQAKSQATAVAKAAQVAGPASRSAVASALNIPRMMHAAVPVAEVAQSKGKKKSAKASDNKAQHDAVATLVKLLSENTGNVEFNADESGLKITGKLTRAKSAAEIAADDAKRKQEQANIEADMAEREQKARVLRDKVKALIGNPPFEAANRALTDVSERSETARLMVSSWHKSSPATVAGCEGSEQSAAASGAFFRVTPRVDSKELEVGEPMMFVISNGRVVPKIQLAGENVQSIEIRTTIVDDEFHLEVKALKVIPIDKHPTLVIAGHTGRTVRVALSAKAKPKAAS